MPKKLVQLSIKCSLLSPNIIGIRYVTKYRSMHLFICMKLHRNYHTDISFNTLKEKGEIKRDIFNCDFQLQKKQQK